MGLAVLLYVSATWLVSHLSIGVLVPELTIVYTVHWAKCTRLQTRLTVPIHTGSGKIGRSNSAQSFIDGRI